MTAMFHEPLPDTTSMTRAPERAHLAILNTAAVLTEQALAIQYPGLEEIRFPSTLCEQPLLLTAYLLAQRSAELRDLIASYQALLDQLPPRPLKTDNNWSFLPF